MSDLKHTPGPWAVGKNAGAVVANEVYAVKQDSLTGHADSEYYGGLLICESVRTPADAKLIAAAPELLEVLIACKSSMKTITVENADLYNAINYAIISATS